MTYSTRWLWMAGLFLLGWLLYLLHPILSPFLIGVLLAYLGDPLVDRLERLRLSRGAGVLVVFALFGLALLLALLVVVPMFGRQLARLYQLAPQMLDWLQGTALPWSQAQLGLSDDFWQFDQLKAAFAEHLGKTTDVLKVVLAQALHELSAFALFAATTSLPRDQELALSRDVNTRLKRIRL